MRYAIRLTLSSALLLCSACTMFEAKKDTPPPVVPKTLSVPVGKNWKVIEEAPVLTNERNDRLPFQMEQSVQPPGVQPVSPAEQRKIETPR